MVLSIKKQNGGKPRLLPGWMGLFWRREIALVAKNWCAAVLTLESNESVFSVGPVSACAVGYDVAHVVDHGVPIKPLTAVTTSEAVLQFIVFLAANWVYYQKIDLYFLAMQPERRQYQPSRAQGRNMFSLHHSTSCRILGMTSLNKCLKFRSRPTRQPPLLPRSYHFASEESSSATKKALSIYIIRVSKKSNGRIESKNIKESLRLKNTAQI